MHKRDLFILLIVIIFFSFVFIVGDNPKKNTQEGNIAVPEEYTQKENNEASVVEEYVRANIRTIATNQPVLGGSWYVVSLTVDPSLDSGAVVYEDGHIQSTASFSYEYKNGEILSISQFNVME